MSWADANLNEEPAERLSLRISELEHAVTSQLSELRNEVGLAAAAMRAGTTLGAGSPIADLEQQLARAVTVSLSAALEAIREALTQAVSNAIAQLALRLDATVETQVASVAARVSSELTSTVSAQFRSQAPAVAPNAPVMRPQWDPADLESVATTLQHSVLLALSSFELNTVAPISADPMEVPATARDVARVNQRLDELRSLLLG